MIKLQEDKEEEIERIRTDREAARAQAISMAGTMMAYTIAGNDGDGLDVNRIARMKL
jgi:hypothetical protein